MKKRLILAGLGAMVILAGLATFAAYTAQWVNITAHVEKEIAVACVDDSVTPPVITDCGYGTVFPENTEEKVVEVALSKSFTTQTVKSDVEYWVLWECKPADETLPPGPTNPCREDLPITDPLHLDGNIRDYVTVTGAGCLDTYDGPTGGVGKLEGIGDGTIDRTSQVKCFYHLKFNPPACEGSYNPLTDPLPASTVVACNKDNTSTDPQQWDEWFDLGDNFKIQVYHHSI